MTLSRYDQWLTEPDQRPYLWTCPVCETEMDVSTPRQMDDQECPGCVAIEHDRAQAEEDAADPAERGIK